MQSNLKILELEQLNSTIQAAAVGRGLVPKNLAANYTRQHAQNKPLIVVAATPKSGSTFLSNTLSKATNLRYFRLCSGYATNEHDLYLPALCMMRQYGCVSQLHMKGTFHNASLMKSFGIRPIILVRQIEDAVVSLMYDLRKKEGLPGFGIGQNGYSFIWQDRSIQSLNDEQLLDAIIDLAVPWYVNFYVSWFRLCEKKSVSALWVTYDELFSDRASTVNGILDFLGVEGAISPELLSKKYSTFRSGKSGGGKIGLSDEQKLKIRKLFSYYPDVDFSRYGV